MYPNFTENIKSLHYKDEVVHSQAVSRYLNRRKWTGPRITGSPAVLTSVAKIRGLQKSAMICPRISTVSVHAVTCCTTRCVDGFLSFKTSRFYPCTSRRDNFKVVDCVWNVMAHAQKPDFVFRRNGRVHLNRLGRQFSRLLAAEVCLSALVMLDTHVSR